VECRRCDLDLLGNSPGHVLAGLAEVDLPADGSCLATRITCLPWPAAAASRKIAASRHDRSTTSLAGYASALVHAASCYGVRSRSLTDPPTTVRSYHTSRRAAARR
jgi:hypothetical protein